MWQWTIVRKAKSVNNLSSFIPGTGLASAIHELLNNVFQLKNPDELSSTAPPLHAEEVNNERRC